MIWSYTVCTRLKTLCLRDASQISIVTDANQTVTLTDVLPNSNALASLLQSMVSPDTATAIMVATLHPEEVYFVIIVFILYEINPSLHIYMT